MKSMISVGAIAVSLALATTSAYAGRVANPPIGTLAGLVVFGPGGAVAGAAVGYSAATVLSDFGGYRDTLIGPHGGSRAKQVPLPRSKPADSEVEERTGVLARTS